MYSRKAKVTESNSFISGSTPPRTSTPIPSYGTLKASCKSKYSVKIIWSLALWDHWTIFINYLTSSQWIESVEHYMCKNFRIVICWYEYGQIFIRWNSHKAIQESGIQRGTLPEKPANVDILKPMECRWLGNKRGAFRKLIGGRPLSQLLTLTSMHWHALDHLHAPKTPLQILGFHNRWTLVGKKESNGCRRTTWFTTIAQILSVFHKGFLPNAPSHDARIFG